MKNTVNWTFRRLFVVGLMCLLVVGCDTVRDWRNRNNPVPTTPIAPPAKPAPKEYTWQQAKVEMTNALIFALSMRSDCNTPKVQFDSTDIALQDVCQELIRNRVMTACAPGVAGCCRLVSRETQLGEWNVILYACDTGEIYLNKTLKVRD